jgi:hypothetical protein
MIKTKHRGRVIPKEKRIVTVLLTEDDYVGLEALLYQYRRRSMSSLIRDIIRTLFMYNMYGPGHDKFFEEVGVDMTKKWDDQELD